MRIAASALYIACRFNSLYDENMFSLSCANCLDVFPLLGLFSGLCHPTKLHLPAAPSAVALHHRLSDVKSFISTLTVSVTIASCGGS